MFITCLSEMWIVKGQLHSRKSHGGPWSNCARCEAVPRALLRGVKRKLEILDRDAFLERLDAEPAGGLGQLKRLWFTEFTDYIPHRIHGAAIYGDIYHQYTPNVSIYHTWILWVLITVSEETSKNDAPFKVQGSPLETKSQRPRRERPCRSFIDGPFFRFPPNKAIIWLRWLYRHTHTYIYIYTHIYAVYD